MAHVDDLCGWQLDFEDGVDPWKHLDEEANAWEPVRADNSDAVAWSVDIAAAEESSEYEDLFKAIQAASRLAAIQPSEDEEYLSQAAFTRAVNFLLDHAQMLMERFGIELPVPRIGAGPDGSVDLHWELSRWELLVNIPAVENGLAAYYGDDYAQQKTRGVFDPKEINLGLMTWLLHK